MATYTVEVVKIKDLKTRLEAMDTAVRTFVALTPFPGKNNQMVLVSKA